MLGKEQPIGQGFILSVLAFCLWGRGDAKVFNYNVMIYGQFLTMGQWVSCRWQIHPQWTDA